MAPEIDLVTGKPVKNKARELLSAAIFEARFPAAGAPSELTLPLAFD